MTKQQKPASAPSTEPMRASGEHFEVRNIPALAGVGVDDFGILTVPAVLRMGGGVAELRVDSCGHRLCKLRGGSGEAVLELGEERRLLGLVQLFAGGDCSEVEDCTAVSTKGLPRRVRGTRSVPRGSLSPHRSPLPWLPKRAVGTPS